MTLNEYQTLAARTIAMDNKADMERHALHGMVAEAGEILEAIINGWDEDHVIKELGDLFWMIAEFCTANGWFLEDIYDLHKHSTDMGLCIEIGRLHGMFQKIYQGHRLDDTQLRKQTSCIIHSVIQIVRFHCRLEICLERNIEKLKARYPDGFDPDRSQHRADGDI